MERDRLETRLLRAAPWLTLGLVTLVFLTRLAGPDDLMDNDQERPAAYVLDAMINGNWLVQHDLGGDVASKPPLYTWLVLTGAIPWDAVNRVTLYLPCALSLLAVAWSVLVIAVRHFGVRAAMIAVVATVVSAPGLKMAALARTDSVFTALTWLTAMSLWSYVQTPTLNRALSCGVVGGLASMTKGPLGVLLALGILLPDVIRRRRIGTLTGWFTIVGLWSAIPLSWFVMGDLSTGGELYAKLIQDELVGHAVESGKGDLPFTNFYKPVLYYLGRSAPWSIPGLASLWNVWKNRRTANDADLRLASYFVVGLTVFSIAPHQRPDHLWPLVPATCLLGAGVIERFLTHRWSTHRIAELLLAGSMIACAAHLAQDWQYRAWERKVEKTAIVNDLADWMARNVAPIDLDFYDAPIALIVRLRTFEDNATYDQNQLALGNAIVVTRATLAGVGPILRWPIATPIDEEPAVSLLKHKRVWPKRVDEAPKAEAVVAGWIHAAALTLILVLVTAAVRRLLTSRAADRASRTEAS